MDIIYLFIMCDVDESVPMDVDVNLFNMEKIQIVLYLNKTIKMNMATIDKFIGVLNEMKINNNNTFSIKKLSAFATPEQISNLQQKLINKFIDDTDDNNNNIELEQFIYQQQLSAYLQHLYNQQLCNEQQFYGMGQYNDYNYGCNYVEPDKNISIKTETEIPNFIKDDTSLLKSVFKLPTDIKKTDINTRYTPSQINKTETATATTTNTNPTIQELRQLRLQKLMDNINKKK